ncbi:MAG TPA: TOBE domain-containing protein, partial [Polyangiaceae bacterium]|nr:TOBE domain-containing protein [Polyangiaceae bacterium]
AIYDEPATEFVASFLGSPRINTMATRASAGVATIAGVELVAPTLRDLDVVVAARPEHVAVRPSDEPAPASALSFVTTVAATEPLGAETILHLEAATGTARLSLRAKVPGFFDPALSSEVRVVIERDRLTWFDAKSGERIREAGRA